MTNRRGRAYTVGMKIVAWLVVIVCALTVVLDPFFIGKDRKPFSAGHYVGELAAVAALLALAGRVLRWW